MTTRVSLSGRKTTDFMKRSSQPSPLVLTERVDQGEKEQVLTFQ